MNRYTTEPGISFNIGHKGLITSHRDQLKLEQAITRNNCRKIIAINENETCVVSLRLNFRSQVVVDFLPMSRNTIWSVMKSKEQGKRDALYARQNKPKEYASRAGHKPGTVNYHTYLIAFDKTFNQIHKSKTITF